MKKNKIIYKLSYRPVGSSDNTPWTKIDGENEVVELNDCIEAPALIIMRNGEAYLQSFKRIKKYDLKTIKMNDSIVYECKNGMCFDTIDDASKYDVLLYHFDNLFSTLEERKTWTQKR